MLTLIGDAHGQYDRYVKMARKRDYTVQVGDLGFKYGCLDCLDPERHKVVGGNHDNYSIIADWPHYLGDFGNCSLGGVDFFFYRGAYSIDRQDRTIGLNWWAEEELKIEAFMEARELYRKTKPRVVVTHDCPELVSPDFLHPGARIYQNITGWALQELFNIHEPDLWVFGHYHVSKSVKRGCTKFVCLNELETFEI